jgi:hypothetical protein
MTQPSLGFLPNNSRLGEGVWKLEAVGGIAIVGPPVSSLNKEFSC